MQNVVWIYFNLIKLALSSRSPFVFVARERIYRNPVRDTFWRPIDLLSTDQSEDLL